ncbi:hypothetical protein DNTS_024891 [Danionella cerebrum]|uniref:Uncharacterized protein n=1 Tax=Danionella cerebrum TaxID=2873325 RepID=A0A553QSQ9_9TELE|nr:hypothetical protein DNTS_024891 [Danionella translucida]
MEYLYDNEHIACRLSFWMFPENWCGTRLEQLQDSSLWSWVPSDDKWRRARSELVSHFVEGHREHQDLKLPVLESISPDTSVNTSDSGIITDTDSAATSRADDEKESSVVSAKEEFIESSVSSIAADSPDKELLAAAHTHWKQDLSVEVVVNPVALKSPTMLRATENVRIWSFQTIRRLY